MNGDGNVLHETNLGFVHEVVGQGSPEAVYELYRHYAADDDTPTGEREIAIVLSATLT